MIACRFTVTSARPRPVLTNSPPQATLFERAVAPSQWTIPAHSSLFTGLYPSAHGVIEAYGQLSPVHPTLAEILQVGGYHTVAFCNNPLVGALDNGLQRGFDEFYNYASAVPNRPNDAQKSDLRRRFRRWFRPYARRMGNQFAQIRRTVPRLAQPAADADLVEVHQFQGQHRALD